VSYVSALVIASVLFLQGIGGISHAGGKANIGGSAPLPPPLHVNTCANAVNTVFSLTCNMSGVAVGDFLAVFVMWYAADSPTGFTDTNGTLIPALSSHPVVWDGGARSVDLYYEQNVNGGTHNFSIAFSTQRLIAIAIEEYSGASTSAPIDGTPTSIVIASNTNPFSCNPVTTTHDNDTIFGAGGITVGTITAGAGYTMRNGINPIYADEDAPENLPGSYAPSFGGSPTHPSVCVALAIKND
jgi:hypothetical protein